MKLEIHPGMGKCILGWKNWSCFVYSTSTYPIGSISHPQASTCTRIPVANIEMFKCFFLVGGFYPPIWKICACQIGFHFPHFSGWNMMKIPKMCETTSQKLILLCFLPLPHMETVTKNTLTARPAKIIKCRIHVVWQASRILAFRARLIGSKGSMLVGLYRGWKTTQLYRLYRDYN